MPLYYKHNNTWKEFATNPYPVGTLVVNQDNDTSPASLVGGTWSKYGVTTSPSIENYYPNLIQNVQCDVDYVSGLVTLSLVCKNTYGHPDQAFEENRTSYLLLSGLPSPTEQQTSSVVLRVWPSGSGIAATAYGTLALEIGGQLYLNLSRSYSTGSYFNGDQNKNFNYYTPNSDPFNIYYTYKRTA